MKLPMLVCALGALAPLAAAQQSVVQDDGSVRVLSSNSGSSTIAAAGSLCTDFNSNNGFAGNMVDIFPVTDMEITGIDVNVDGTGLPVTVDVWYIPGTSFGAESSATGWTLIGSYTGTSAGADLPTYIDMAGNGVQFDGGSSYGLYIDITSYSTGTGINYTNGNTQGQASGNDEWSNADLKIVANCGKAQGHTSSTFYPRNWNGCIYYETGGFNLAVSSLQSGQTTTVSSTGGAPGTIMIAAYSFKGSGPTPTPYGLVDLSLPITQVPAETVDGSGSTSATYFIPPAAAGRMIYIQAVNVIGPGNGAISNLVTGMIL